MLDKTANAIETLMQDIGTRARGAARVLALAPTAQKNAALAAMAEAVEAQVGAILAANAEDLARAAEAGMSGALVDRLTLDPERVAGIAQAIRAVEALTDPVGATITEWDRPNGLRISRVRTPLGVVGVIYESRPNVTADAGALCLKAGNAVILRGGSDSAASSAAIHAALVAGLEKAGLPAGAIQIVPTPDRAAVGLMLTGLGGAIDVIVPRGGRSLVARVQDEARVPVFAHLEGLCHVYVDGAADLAMAEAIVVNAKMRRTGVCGAAETLLIDRAVAATHLVPLLSALSAAGCQIRADEPARTLFPAAIAATAEDWDTEYLDAIISVALVDGIDGAIAHIERHSSHRQWSTTINTGAHYKHGVRLLV